MAFGQTQTSTTVPSAQRSPHSGRREAPKAGWALVHVSGGAFCMSRGTSREGQWGACKYQALCVCDAQIREVPAKDNKEMSPICKSKEPLF